MNEQYIVNDEEQLRKIIPRPPAIMDKRLQTALDDNCLELIQHAKLYVLASSENKWSIRICSIETLDVLNRKQILLSGAAVGGEVSNESIQDTPVSLYFLIPGVGHSLRVNGDVSGEKRGLVLNLRNAYLHCARAAVRAGLWDMASNGLGAGDTLSTAEFLKRSAYLLLKTQNLQGHIELSPRGDQAGFVNKLDANTLFIPERPGNKVAVSLRNILQNSRVELLMFLPADNVLLKVQGKASLSICPEYLKMAKVGNKTPKLGILIQQCQFSMAQSSALSALRQAMDSGALSTANVKSFSKAFAEHTSGRGIKGKLAHIVIDGVVKKDLRSLY